MAGPLCMSGDGRPATFVGTMLATGDGFTLCDECLVSWCAALLQATTGVDPAPFIAAVSESAEAVGDGNGGGGAGSDPEAEAPIGRTRGGFPVGRSPAGSRGRGARTGGRVEPSER